MSSRPDCIFEIHQLWQSGFSRMYSNCCCSCSFEPEIIKIGQSSHNVYSNNIVNLQESTTVLNACTKNVWKLIEYIYEYIYIYIYICVCVCVCVCMWVFCMYIYIYIYIYIYVCVYVCVSLCEFVCVCTCCLFCGELFNCIRYSLHVILEGNKQIFCKWISLRRGQRNRYRHQVREPLLLLVFVKHHYNGHIIFAETVCW